MSRLRMVAAQMEKVIRMNALRNTANYLKNKDWMKVVKIDKSIASISLFRINIPLFSKRIGLGFKLTRMESDNTIKLG